MKNLITYLKALWRRGLDSQRKEVGVISEEATIEHPLSTYSAPFGTCWQPSGKLHSVVRCAAMLVMLFTIGSGNVWGAIEAGTYELITSTSGLVSGSHYIIVSSKSNGTAYAIARTSKSDNRATVAVTVSSEKVSVAANSDVMTFTLGGDNTNGWTFSTDNYAGTAGMLAATSSSNNRLGVVASPGNNGKWAITFSSGLAKPVAKGSYTRKYMKYNYNNGTPIFNCYSGSGSESLYIYKKAASGYSITYHCNGATSDCPSNASGQSALPNPLPTPAKTGFTFGGWYTDAALTSAASAGATLSANADLYAKWTCNVTLNRNGATETINNIVEGTALDDIDGTGAQGGCSAWTFVGWSKTQRAAQNVSTPMTLVTEVDGAGPYYAVYSHTEGGGGSSTVTDVITAADLEATGTSYVAFEDVAGSSSDAVYAGQSAKNGSDIQLRGTSPAGIVSTTSGGTVKSVVIEWSSSATDSRTINVYGKSTAYSTAADLYNSSTYGTNVGSITYTSSSNYQTTYNFAADYEYVGIRMNSSATRIASISITWTTSGGGTTYYSTTATCCTDPGLNYGTGSVTKTFGNGTFKNTLTNSHSVSVTYESNNTDVATVASDGTVTIQGAGNATITARFAGNSTYCADEASYTLTVNKADISPTLTYTPNSVAVGENTSAPTVGANPGSGGVTYAITSATPAGCATIDAGTGVVSGVAVGSVTVTATVAATANYNGGTATATVTINAAAYFPNNKTVFIQGESSSAWEASACVKAWFNASGAGGAAQTTYWLFDATDGDAGKKLYATIVPATGNLNQVTLQRFASNCSDFWNNNGTLTKASDGGSNTFRSTGSGTSNVAWNGTGMTLDLKGDPNSWGSSLGTFADQGNGVWTATYNNYAPANAAGESQEFKISTNYNGWIGNTGSNNNATLDGMHVGSTYNITATLDVKDHSLTMSKTFVKGTVHFDLQGHGSSIADLTNVYAGSKISAPSPAPTDAAYDFGGWFKEAGCTNEWNFASDEVNETMTLYAKWTLKTYAIAYLPGANGTGTVPAGVKNHGESFTLSSSTFSRDHYTQDGWSTSDGGAKVYELGGSYTTNAALTLYPHWTPATYTVTWYAGGTAAGNITTAGSPTTSVAYNNKVATLPTNPDGSACDKVFVGWTNTTSYTHGTSLLFTDAAGSPAITGATNFYAVFATVSSGAETLLSEDFSEITAGNSTSTSGSSSSWGRNSNFSTGAQTYQAGGAVRLGTGTNTGNLTTKQLTAAIGDEITVAFKVKGWSSVEGDISVSGLYSEFTKPSDITYTAVMDGDFESKSVTVTLTKANPYIIIATTAKRAFIDDLVITKSGTTYTGHTITCADCGTSVTPTYTAAPTGGTVSVTKSASPVASGSTVKTCTAVELSVTITPASHYTLTGFTASGLTTGTATISPAVGSTLPKTTETTFTVTVSAGATGTLNLTPTLEEDAHKVISWVVHGSSASIADGHGTTWVYSGENLTAIPDAPDAPTGCDDKEFVGWSENDGGATEGDASDYTDLFTNLGGAPTGITTDKTFTAVFATPAAGLGGTVMWDEPFDGDAGDQPSSPTSGATVYGSASIAYNCASTTYCKLYTDNLASGGAASPELLIPKSSRSEAFEVTGIPTAGQTELTLTYMAKDALSVTTGTSGVTVGDASADGKLYTRTITIDQSGLGVATFGLTFAKSTDSNSRLDDIHLEVPGSSSMSGYVTTCEDTWTITYYKNTEDAVTNLPSPTGISKSTGSGTLSSKVPVRYGYTFDGWATSAGGSVAYAAGAAVSSVSADMDLYAKWSVTPVTEINLSKTSLDKYVGDPSVTLSVLSVLPDGANTSVTWSSSNSSIATVNSTTGEVNFVAEGTANIIATSSITSGTTATCVVTVWAKPTVSFLDNLHSLTEDKDGNALSGYNLTDVAGTPVVFPILANQSAGSGTCEDEHYVFVGWTTSDNNTDPEDHLVTSHNLTNGDNITYYAVWADGVAGTTYTKLTSSTFKTSPAKYVIGAEYNGTTRYFYSCEKTDKYNSWGYVTADLASNTPIEFTLSGTAAALVATSTEVSARYLKPLATKDFQLSASSQTVELKSDGTIYNNNVDETDWRLLYNMAGGLRWYSSTVSGSASAYFYEVVAGGEVNYRTSCCADKVSAPIVTATKTSTTVTLTWAAVSGATGYELQWNGGAWTAATSGVVKSDLTPNTNYSWRVRATYVPPKCGADIASGSTTTNQVYHVTYAGGSGTGTCNATGSTTDATAYEAGATVTLQSNGFTLVGHTFNEWTEDDEDITISSNQFTMPEHDVVITATWTPKVDKFYDRMHDGTDASHGGIADGDGKYYITREGCSYTVPSLTDNTSGATACHTKHYVLMGWTAESHLNSDGTLKTGHEGYVYTGGGTQTATGATYYAVWAEVEE